MLDLRNNSKYEVLTPTGWSKFDGIKPKAVDHYLRLEFNDGSFLGCTENHLIKVDDNFIEAQWLAIGQVIGNKSLCKINYIHDKTVVYDLINVENEKQYYTNGVVSHNCEFHGSSGTLIAGHVLKSLAIKTSHIRSTIEGLTIRHEPIPGHRYVITADTSRGRGLDYSAFLVIDVTEIPYKIACVYKDNNISPIVYPSIIAKMGTYYNSAYVLVEINDNGQQVSDGLFDEYEYENILSTVEKDKKITLSWASGGRSIRGIRTTKSTKRLGCSLIKTLIESYKIIIEDYDIIAELSTFINKGTSYEADDGAHDDLVMCLVIFAWMTNQTFFADLCNMNIKDKIYRDQMKLIEDEMLPSPLRGDDYDERLVEDGSVWDVVRI